ncbi:phage baseplate assembly protein V [Maridesulfovibrio sp.]|uniref:phage baseplate assembly protein V n=1 Tax=Maridesulfovibrio sp. TaxID=2795000 RepID=UPI003AFFC1CE
MTGIPGLMQKISELFSALTQIIRVGTVASVNADNGTVRVKFSDADANGKPLISDELAVLFRKTLRDKFYCMPDVDEQVLCIFLPFGLRQGFCLGAIYSEADGVPVADKDVCYVEFSDGTWFRYHRTEHHLSGHVVNGCADLTVDHDADLTVGQDLTAVATNITAKAGKHVEVSAGQSIDLSAPHIGIKGFVSQTDMDGSIGTEHKRAHTQHEGSYTLTGTGHIDRLTVHDLTVTNPINGTIRGD